MNRFRDIIQYPILRWEATERSPATHQNILMYSYPMQCGTARVCVIEHSVRICSFILEEADVLERQTVF
jgi:hypothetical protein